MVLQLYHCLSFKNVQFLLKPYTLLLYNLQLLNFDRLLDILSRKIQILPTSLKKPLTFMQLTWGPFTIICTGAGGGEEFKYCDRVGKDIQNNEMYATKKM